MIHYGKSARETPLGNLTPTRSDFADPLLSVLLHGLSSVAAARAGSGSQEAVFVFLTVEDTGIGIDPVTRKHLFEPFFTTKEEGKGTGLGLSTVYGIVNHAEGWIEVDSHPGKGTRFSIYFPAIRAIPSRDSHGDTPTSGGTETVLVVEDREDGGNFLVDPLQTYGYHVIAASAAAEARQAILARGPGCCRPEPAYDA